VLFRKLLLFAAVMSVLMLISTGSEACTLGAKDCRCADTTKPCTEGFWWYCESCGSETCWIYKGTKCTMPKTKTSNALDDTIFKEPAWPNLVVAAGPESQSKAVINQR
jgi:hypothetical protein